MRLFFVGASVCAAAIVLSSCDASTRSENVKITVQIEADGKVFTGVGVQKFTCRDGIKMVGSMDMPHCYISGEAIVVDMKERATIYVVMEVNGATGGISYVRSLKEISGIKTPRSAFKIISRDATIYPQYPMLVSFRSERNMQSVYDASDYISNVTITAEKTKDHVTRGRIEKHLAWVASPEIDTYLNGESGTRGITLADNLQIYHFKRK